LDVEVRGGRFNYPSKTRRDAQLVEVTLGALRAEGVDAACRYARWTLDAGFFSRHGVPVVMVGPGDESMAHTDAEMVLLGDVEAAARSYLRILRAMASTS
jgi:acetylornithine deacetylase/succinyl-diaminopimelate desuccinylase-like protein